MFVRVPLNRIINNPFQTRLEIGDVADLVESLLKMRDVRPVTSGLIQVPPGRIVAAGQVLDPRKYGSVRACLKTEPEAVVEIAAGHRRLRAFRQLFEAGEADYATFPVDVQVLDEQAMADIAWEENAKRKDLSPIEEAQALRRAIERFGWTQAQVGERWGLSQSAVAAARGKSERVYERLAQKIVPVPMTMEAAEKARELVEAHPFYERYCTGDAICLACGRKVERIAEYMPVALKPGSSERLFLCWSCYRVATNWTPPSVSGAENLLDHAIDREASLLENLRWPLDESIGDGDPAVQSARCADCATRDEELCFDSTCARAKEKWWYMHEVAQLKNYLQTTFGATAPIIDESGGHNLRSYNDVDKALIESGTCAPGKCDRLQFRHVTYRSSSYIYICDELPFIYNCNNANAHRHCQRRYLTAHRSDDEIEQEKKAQKQITERRGQARAMMDRATLAMARALLDGHAGAWKRLVTHIGGTPKDGQTAESAAQCVAETLLDMRHIVTTWRFELDETLELVEQFIADEMRKAGVALLPSADDLTRKLERIAAFILDDELISPRRDLTPAQISGNLVNLDRIHAQAEDLHEAGTLPDQDFIRLNVWACELREALNSISQEIP